MLLSGSKEPIMEEARHSKDKISWEVSRFLKIFVPVHTLVLYLLSQIPFL